jgi:hypothetical protein
MKIAYLDCFSGISGDMILGALLDAGLDFKCLERDLAGLALDDYELYTEKVIKQGITGTKLQVLSLEGHVHRHLGDIREIIGKSDLPQVVKDNSIKVFTRLAEAEAKIHGVSVEEVHFHEVGAVDAIVDIVGAAIGFWRLGIEKIYASSVHTGTGFVKAAHGLMPVPAPATLELLRGVPVYARDIYHELVTPTGAAILTTYCQDFGPMPEMKAERIGYGAGEKNLEIPNLLRLTLGELTGRSGKAYQSSVNSVSQTGPVDSLGAAGLAGNQGIREGEALTLEVNIDDMNPEFYEHLFERLFQAGAMDVYLQDIQMKKNRPATMLTVQLHPDKLPAIQQLIFKETTSIGFRVYPIRKYMLPYELHTVETEWGSAQVKVAYFEGKVCTISPEYEDCRRLARESGLPIKMVYDLVKSTALQGNRAIVDLI